MTRHRNYTKIALFLQKSNLIVCFFVEISYLCRICEKQKSATWGDGWLKELSRELMAEFPDMKGFSYRNLRYIRQRYEFYNQRFVIWQQPVAKLVNDNWATACCPIREQISQSASLNTNCQSSCLKTYKASCLPSKI